MIGQISPFEYVSILVSIILGLGITQLLSSFSDLLYNFKKVKFYWPHTIWIVFILFLHIQDWFITYELRTITEWYLPQMIFVLLYPITLFTCAKMLLPTNVEEENRNMKLFYQSQFPIIFALIALSIVLSVSFNMYFLNNTFMDQLLLLIFLVVMIYFVVANVKQEWAHKALSIIVIVATILSIILEENVWVIK